MFLSGERGRENLNIIKAIDPIYEKCLALPRDTKKIDTICYYLQSSLRRKRYDDEIRRFIRKNNPDWQIRDEKYLIRYPQTINDFCREAAYMRNCLLTFGEALVHNDTIIMFMRRSEDVNTPFITIEIYKGYMRQAYHRFNEPCNEEEKDWLREFCNKNGIKMELYE